MTTGDETCAECGSMVDVQGEWEEGDMCWQCKADKYDEMKDALESAHALLNHAIGIGHLGEGSTKGWAEEVLKKIEGAGVTSDDGVKE